MSDMEAKLQVEIDSKTEIENTLAEQLTKNAQYEIKLKNLLDENQVLLSQLMKAKDSKAEELNNKNLSDSKYL